MLLVFWSAAANGQDARRIVEPLDPAIVDNATIVDVVVSVASTAQPAVAKLEAATAKRAARATKSGADPDDLALLPFAQMFPEVMKTIGREFNLNGPRRVKLAVSIETIKRPNGFLAVVAVTSEEIAGLVEVFDFDDGRPLGIFHIDVMNTYGDGFGLDALARGPPREFLAREFSREAVRVLAGRKSREKPEPAAADALPVAIVPTVSQPAAPRP